MSKNIWNFFAPVYEFSMRVQKDIYSYLYERIGEVAKGKVVLELATGPGMIARHIAPAAKSVVATDLAPKMIETALKAKNPENLSFEVADATSLRFEDNSFSRSHRKCASYYPESRKGAGGNPPCFKG
jgi:Methylase involved in ubiquinone/menaquinone biosynthesis